jgi:hypothetical protein
MNIVSLAIYIIIAVVVLGIAWIVVKQAQLPIPQWVWQIIGLVILGVVAILAIRFLVSLSM